MENRIQKILEYAIMAPSGDNCQPWKFKIEGLAVELLNDPDKDNSLYNITQRASLIAHGALLENIKISAPSVGLHPTIELFPNSADSNHIATITFTECKKVEHPLFAAIPKRHTNRECYSPVKISTNQIQNWQSLAKNSENRIWATTNRQQIEKLANPLAYNDRLVFEVPKLHHFLFEQIRWTDVEAKTSGDGLDIKTLGLNVLDKSAFRFLKNWVFVSLINKVGFSHIIQLKARQLLKKASAIVVITIPSPESLNYVTGGMLWQRFLLDLACQGLTAQPIAGLACLMQSAYEGKLGGNITVQQQTKLQQTRGDLLQMINVNERAIPLVMFRIGHGIEVIRAMRKPVTDFINNH